jgi:aryl-phospho-beta-D-glucosidase BglC (GH1 family)
LGNTLEPPCGEGCWGPPATEALIQAVADAGFHAIRIPCVWDSHANQSTYVIDPAYLARVKQVVNWCLARNLYVILNCHWDNGWLENNITDTVNPVINAKQQAYWTQIAEAFIDYDERLMFAGCNEPNADTAAETATLLVYLQTFVNAVRAVGGQNATRWLIVQGPNTDIDLTCSLMNTLPTDPTPGRMMVEVHYYSPWNFTGLTQDEWWGNQFFYWGQGYHSLTDPAHNATWGEEEYLEAQFEKMKTKFIDQGIPVIVGEFCARKRTDQLSGADLDLHLRSRTYFHKKVVDTANSKGLKPFFWDIAGVTFNWTTGAQIDPDTITALTGGPALPPSDDTGDGIGTILYKRWDGIAGESVSDLTSNANYPDHPSYTGRLTRLEGPANIAESYGTRIRGYLYPPATGNYTFWISGDDNCQLWLSTDGSPSNASLIASVPGWTDPRQWNKYSSQQSSPRTLTAGRKYYIEVLHKEYTGGDNIAVAWQGPGISQEVIAGRYLSPWFVGLYGDFNNSGTVTLDDLSELANLWLQEDCVETSRIDLNGDCVVDFTEFSRFAENWLNP